MQRKRCFMPGRMILILPVLGFLFTQCGPGGSAARIREDFGRGWKFHPGDLISAEDPATDDSGWRVLNLPHDWSIEGEFSSDHPATPGGGALPGGIGWYRKTFALPESQKDKRVFVEFDGVYRNSEVFLNGVFLGVRPNGYISFRYELTPHLKYGGDPNVLAVRVDNSRQPNSRWYTGSGIYRHVRLVVTDPVHIDHWGTFVFTPEVGEKEASVEIRTRIRNASDTDCPVILKTIIYDESDRKVASVSSDGLVPTSEATEVVQTVTVRNPARWSIAHPALYRAVSHILSDGRRLDDYETVFGIRTFAFDSVKGFFLNGKPIKIHGVCNHHDLGCLGAAVNTRAIERQLEILRQMGVNSIRTAHNPPAPELLDLCDRMGFLVMNEAFDMWKKKKSPYDYALDWDAWHRRDLTDFILRDRNHPSVFVWSIGNEILEQWDSTGVRMTRELAAIVRELDPTRPITAGCNDPRPHNALIRSGALDLIGYNYHHGEFEAFPQTFPGQAFIATETHSALATRGRYDMPSDEIRIWPERWDKPFEDGNPDHTCSAYDNCHTPWGSTHQETWRIVRKHDYLSGLYIWTGFDYLGEPTPYGWPSRSSYFGVIDLAGFPKDAYYFYQAEWTEKPVLHLFPHWNWQEGEPVDVWAYTNCEEVELFLDGVSRGVRRKTDDRLHLMWRIPFSPGVLRAVGRTGGEEILIREVRTAGPAARIVLEADRRIINADGRDLSFVTVRIEDASGTLVPDASPLVLFDLEGEGEIAGVDNGLQTSHEPFRSDRRKAFNGLCLAVIRSTETPGKIVLHARGDGLTPARLHIRTK